MKTGWEIGEETRNKEGYKMKLLTYYDNNKVDVLMDGKHILRQRDYGAFLRGTIKNPFHKSVCGVGYLGEGPFKSGVGKNRNRQYNAWTKMLSRCYCSNGQPISDWSVDEEWHNFQSFAKWDSENYYTVGDEKMSLSGALRADVITVYASYTCVYLPQTIIRAIAKTGGYSKYNLPRGVIKEKNRYVAVLYARGRRKKLGSFLTPEDAFAKYKHEREVYVKGLALIYKNQIPEVAFNALICWEAMP